MIKFPNFQKKKIQNFITYYSAYFQFEDYFFLRFTIILRSRKAPLRLFPDLVPEYKITTSYKNFVTFLKILFRPASSKNSTNLVFWSDVGDFRLEAYLVCIQNF